MAQSHDNVLSAVLYLGTSRKPSECTFSLRAPRRHPLLGSNRPIRHPAVRCEGPVDPSGPSRRTVMTEPRVRAIPEGMHTITPHIVVRDAARAAEVVRGGSERRGAKPHTR